MNKIHRLLGNILLLGILPISTNVWSDKILLSLHTSESPIIDGLHTLNADDVRFNTSRQCQPGVSRYETAGARRIENSNNPQHGTGEIDSTITLIFQKTIVSQ